jgi:hypothetical protein
MTQVTCYKGASFSCNCSTLATLKPILDPLLRHTHTHTHTSTLLRHGCYTSVEEYASVQE